MFFGNTGSRSLAYDGTKYVFATANLALQGTLVANAITAAANVTLGSGVYIVGDITGNANTLSRSVIAGSFMSGGGALSTNVTLNANASAAATASVLVARDANSSFSANVVTASLSGTATGANTLLVSGTLRSATSNNTVNTIVARDSSGNFSANIISGTATSARYADLAELYLADKDYPIGTVVKIGGEKEITEYTPLDYIRALGVISNKPAFLMNKDLEKGVAVALKGRVPIRVIGVIKKGQGLGSCPVSGVAAIDNVNYFAIALEDYTSTEEGIIEAVIL